MAWKVSLIDSMKTLLERELPDLVLTGTSAKDNDEDVIEQTIISAARELGIFSEGYGCSRISGDFRSCTRCFLDSSC